MEIPSPNELSSLIHDLMASNVSALKFDAENVTVNEEEINVFFANVSVIINEKHKTIENNIVFKWLNSQPSYSYAYESVFGEYGKDRLGDDFVDLMTQISFSYIAAFEESDKQKALNYFLHICCYTNVDSWFYFYAELIWLYFYDSNGFEWRTTGYALSENAKSLEHIALVNNLLDRDTSHRYLLSSELIQQLEFHRNDLENRAVHQESKHYDPIHRKEDSTSRQRYALFYIWRWFAERNYVSPSAEVMSNFLQVLDETPSERNIARSLAKWENDSPIIRKWNLRLDITEKGRMFNNEMDRQVKNLVSHVFMGRPKIKGA